MTIRIECIKKIKVYDGDGDTSYMGEYTDTYSPWAIDRRTGRYIFDLEKETRQDQLPEVYEEYLGDCKDDNIVPMEYEDFVDCWVEDCDEIVTGAGYRYWVDGWEQPSKEREYRYFAPYAGGATEGSEDYCKYGKLDFARMENFARGDWQFVGVYAQAKIIVNDTIQTVQSGALYGMESDAESDYFEDIIADELIQLSDILVELGFSAEDIAAATTEAEWQKD